MSGMSLSERLFGLTQIYFTVITCVRLRLTQSSIAICMTATTENDFTGFDKKFQPLSVSSECQRSIECQ